MRGCVRGKEDGSSESVYPSIQDGIAGQLDDELTGFLFSPGQ